MLERLADVSAGLVLGDGKSDELAKYLEGVNGVVAVVPPSYHERPTLEQILRPSP